MKFVLLNELFNDKSLIKIIVWLHIFLYRTKGGVTGHLCYPLYTPLWTTQKFVLYDMKTGVQTSFLQARTTPFSFAGLKNKFRSKSARTE